MDILKENKVILIVVVVIIVLLSWYGMSGGFGSGQSDSLISTNVSSQKVVDDRELLELLTNMRSIKLDGHIFESPTYMSLQDFGRSIVPEPVGRQDPFAPLPKTEVTITGGGGLSEQSSIE